MTLEVREVPTADLTPYHKNPRKGNVDLIAKSLKLNGQYKPIVVNEGTLTGRPMEVLAGNHTLQAAEKLGWDSIQVVTVDVSEEETIRIVAADNRTSDFGTYDDEVLVELLGELDDLEGTGYSQDDLEDLLSSVDSELDLDEDEEGGGELPQQFGIFPFSVISLTSPKVLERKKKWVALGIDSKEGRAHSKPTPAGYANFYPVKAKVKKLLGREPSFDEVLESKFGGELVLNDAALISIFNPALSEMLVKWFSAKGFKVLDPWAGGSVRGIVTTLLGREYTGIDLRQEQIDENVAQWEAMRDKVGRPGEAINWLVGDSRTELAKLEDESFDFSFGCPPYYDLEVYSSLEEDLSNMSPEDFDREMTATAKEIFRVLKQDSFAAFVVGDTFSASNKGLSMTKGMIDSFEEAGFNFLQEAIVVAGNGSAAMRTKRRFPKHRKFARIHQKALVFVKGDNAAAGLRINNENELYESLNEEIAEDNEGSE